MDIDRSKDTLEGKDMDQGVKQFEKINDDASAIAEEMSKILIENCMRQEDKKYNLSTCILGTAKVLSIMASFMYDTEEDFLADMKRSRIAVTADVIPALLAPEPCGICDECKNGHPEECIHPNVRGEYTTTRFLPLLVANLIEYDLFNKILHANLPHDENIDEAVKKEGEKENEA